MLRCPNYDLTGNNNMLSEGSSMIDSKCLCGQSLLTKCEEV